MKKRILVISQHFYPEMVSTGLQMTELSVGLASIPGNTVSVYCSYPSKREFQGTKAPFEIYKNIQIKRVRNIGTEHSSIARRALFGIFFLLKAFLYALFKRKQYDTIIVTTNPPFLGLVPALAKRLLNKKFVLVTGDIYPQIAVKLNILSKNSMITRIWTFITIFIFKAADRIVVIGKDMQLTVENIILPKYWKNIRLIHNWSNSKKITPIAREDNVFIKEHGLQDKHILMYSGNIGRTHNIEPILEAAKELNGMEKIVFVIIGAGYKQPAIQKFIDTHHLTNMLLLSFQPFDKLAHVLSAATLSFVCLEDIFTGLSVPSKTYGIMASGTPVIGLLKNDSEIARTIIQFNCGIVYNSQSANTLSNTILSLVDNPVLLAKMSTNAYSAFIDHFDLSIAIEKYEHLLSEIA